MIGCKGFLGKCVPALLYCNRTRSIPQRVLFIVLESYTPSFSLWKKMILASPFVAYWPALAVAVLQLPKLNFSAFPIRGSAFIFHSNYLLSLLHSNQSRTCQHCSRIHFTLTYETNICDSMFGTFTGIGNASINNKCSWSSWGGHLKKKNIITRPMGQREWVGMKGGSG